jgi:hypothetical protein
MPAPDNRGIHSRQVQTPTVEKLFVALVLHMIAISYRPTALRRSLLAPRMARTIHAAPEIELNIRLAM